MYILSTGESIIGEVGEMVTVGDVGETGEIVSSEEFESPQPSEVGGYMDLE